MEQTNYTHSDVFKLSSKIFAQLKKVINGKDTQLFKIILTILAGGHILLEDVPGVGKTTLALATAKALSLNSRRIQFTPDLLASDIMGFSVYNSQTGNFEYMEGGCMTNILLADEINRASSRTQSALLEVMEEKRVTVDGITRELPKPFFVIATQNPLGTAGTQPLPESQLDRFLIKISMGYPKPKDELEMLKARHAHNPLDDVQAVTDEYELMLAIKTVEKTFVNNVLYEYIVNLSCATRKNKYIDLGLSPRGTLALAGASKAVAVINGRDFVIPDDVKYIFGDIARHRCVMSSKVRIDGLNAEQVLLDILQKVPVPKI